MSNNKRTSTVTKYYVRGMHCASCELIIEKKLRKIEDVVNADVSVAKGIAVVETKGSDSYAPEAFDEYFEGDGYLFSYKPFGKNNKKNARIDNCDIKEEETETGNLKPFLAAGLILLGFFVLQKSGFSSLVSVSATSALPVFFLFGLLAGVSSCAALVGGIVLSMSKQWLSNYCDDDDMATKAQPHILFNAGRVVSYGLLGGILGLVGNFFRLSPSFSAMLVISVSIVMVLLGLQMLGVKALQQFQIRLPKSITGKISDEENFQGKYAPFLMGALTFFLPCGFTITAQTLALSSGSPLAGAMIMGLFALGTVPGLLAIGLGSTKMLANKKTSKQFSTVAGMLVLAFSVFNINSQLAVLGVSNLSDVLAIGGTNRVLGESTTNSKTPLVPLVGGKQVIKLEASSDGYNPNRFRVQVGKPVRMEVTDIGTSGCTNAIISKLFDGQIDLTPGETSVKEFTPKKVGVYKFTCWMGMVSGTIEVVDEKGSVGSDTAPVGSGAKGCGCGGGGSGSCGGSK